MNTVHYYRGIFAAVALFGAAVLGNANTTTVAPAGMSAAGQAVGHGQPQPQTKNLVQFITPGWTFSMLPAGLTPVSVSRNGQIVLLRGVNLVFYRWYLGSLERLGEAYQVRSDSLFSMNGDGVISINKKRGHFSYIDVYQPTSASPSITYFPPGILASYPPVPLHPNDTTNFNRPDDYTWGAAGLLCLDDFGRVWFRVYSADSQQAKVMDLNGHVQVAPFITGDERESIYEISRSGHVITGDYFHWGDRLLVDGRLVDWHGKLGKSGLVLVYPDSNNNTGEYVGPFVVLHPDGRRDVLPEMDNAGHRYDYAGFDETGRVHGQYFRGVEFVLQERLDGNGRPFAPAQYDFLDYVPLCFPENSGWTASEFVEVYEGFGEVRWDRWRPCMVAPGTIAPQLGIAVNASGQEVPFVAVPTLGSLAVDANRDGQIKLPSEDNSDATSVDKPFRFWLNDDIDRNVTYTNAEQISDFIASHVTSLGVNEVEEDDVDTAKAQANSWNPADWMNNRLYAKRDLEDFTRLWVSTQGMTAAFLPKSSTDNAEADLYLGLQWADAGKVGHPAIKIYPAAEADGGTKYLNDATGTAATEQVNFDYAMQDFRDTTTPDISAMNAVRDTDFFVIPPRYFAHLSDVQPKTFFLFEGTSVGTGKLKLIILRKEGSTFTKIGEGPGVWMDLKEPGSCIQRWTCGDGALGDVVNYTPNGAITPPSTEEEKDMVLYVHGYNMKPNEKQRWIETTYKRLWHLGFKGKVGGFTWPCAQSALPFDESEEKAWQAGAQLKLLLAALKTAGYRVHVLAHSQGNVVMGEALRQAGPNSELISTYIASQAAIPAHCYDKTLPEVDFSTDTPEIYGRYWNGGDQHLPETWPASSPSYLAPSRVQRGAGKFVNYYNQQDYALTGNGLSLLADGGSQPGWMTDQRMKPNLGYWYSNLVGFEEDPLMHIEPKHFKVPDDRFTIFSFCAEARSLALGATSTGGVFAATPSVNLTDSSFSFRNQHIYHSAQFRSFYAVRWQYWKQVLQSCDVDVRAQP